MMRIPLLKRLNSVKPSDCLDIDGNKSILTDWKNPDTQENDTEKKEMVAIFCLQVIILLLTSVMIFVFGS